MRARGFAVVLVLLLSVACASKQEALPRKFTIGVHDVTLKVPVGWEHLSHGLEHRFHCDLSQISLADIGPATRAGYRREVEHARELFRNYQVEDAKAHLGTLQLRSAFSRGQRWERFAESWYVARDGGLKRDFTRTEVETAYAAVLREIEALATPDLPTLVERVLPDLDHGAQRDVAKQRQVVIDECPGMQVETWDRLSHDHRRSYLFVLNEGNLLVARTELGKYAEVQPAFDALVDSLEIHPRAEGAS